MKCNGMELWSVNFEVCRSKKESKHTCLYIFINILIVFTIWQCQIVLYNLNLFLLNHNHNTKRHPTSFIDFLLCPTINILILRYLYAWYLSFQHLVLLFSFIFVNIKPEAVINCPNDRNIFVNGNDFRKIS